MGSFSSQGRSGALAGDPDRAPGPPAGPRTRPPLRPPSGAPTEQPPPRVAETKAIRGFERAFVLHFHPEWSAVLVHRGTSRARIGSAFYDVSAGDVVLIPPFVPHVCNPDRKGHWSYDLLLIEGPHTAARGSGDGAVLVRRACDGCRALFGRALASLDAGDLFAHLQEHAGLSRTSRANRRSDPRIEAAAERLAANLERPPRLDILAREAGMDAPAFIRTFRRSYGITPHAWVISLRVDRAKAMLRGGISLAEAALEAGFVDQSHFSRHFVRLVGLTPAAWVRENDNFVQDRPRPND